ncbi:SPFH domain-containing protein [Cerasicoccus maritimus]|uniref:SPFH domain-containing protein n=1 Tax=Cerasicoccus maritimus TaxID=490089 RepID=UPI002852859C|nr:SPFH domain-containing protein [Cerasicoccus maritimus]
MEYIIISSLVALFIIAMAIKGVTLVRQSETLVVERLGRYHRTLPSGINVIWPIVETVRVINWRYTTEVAGKPKVKFQTVKRIDLRETVYDFPRQNVITRDNVAIEINALLYFQITDPVKAVYEIANLPNAIEKLAQTTLRNVIGELDLDETLSSRDHINQKLRVILDEATDKWGVKVNRVELQDINPPQDIRDAMEKQMRAERQRRAAILEAEGQKKAAILEAEGVRESAILRAEGDRQAEILRAEAESNARQLVAQGESNAIRSIHEAIGTSGENADSTRYLIAVRYLDSLKTMTAGDATKTVYMPYEATGILSSLGGIKELMASQQPPSVN